jgi:hypothetical protein
LSINSQWLLQAILRDSTDFLLNEIHEYLLQCVPPIQQLHDVLILRHLLPAALVGSLLALHQLASCHDHLLHQILESHEKKVQRSYSERGKNKDEGRNNPRSRKS